MKSINKIFFIVTLIVLCTVLSSCYDRKEIDDKAYVVTMGLESGKTNYLKMTLEFAVPSRMQGGEGGGSGGADGGGNPSSSVTTIEIPTIYAGINMVNTYISKEVDFTHAKLVVFSEELARKGLQKYIHAMIRNREFRGNMMVVVSVGSAEEYIRNAKPEIELNIAKYHELNLQAYKYTGFTANTELIRFYLLNECTCIQPYATLAGVNKFDKPEQFDTEKSTYKDKGREYPLEGDFHAGDLPKTYAVKSEIMGLAVFDGGKMVGKLDGEETVYLNMLYGTYDRSNISIPDPLRENDFVLLDVRQSRTPKQRTEIVDGKPHAKASVMLEADIISIQSGINYEDLDKLQELEAYTEDFLKKGMLRFLEKTKKLNVDVCGFGRNLKMRYLLWNEWVEFYWLKRYKDITFDLEVDVKIRRPGLMIRTAPGRSTKGEVMH